MALEAYPATHGQEKKQEGAARCAYVKLTKNMYEGTFFTEVMHTSIYHYITSIVIINRQITTFTRLPKTMKIVNA